MAESEHFTDPFDNDWFHLWNMIESTYVVERHQSVPPDSRPAAETMKNEIRRFDEKGGPQYTARVVAAALAYGEYEMENFEKILADTRAAVELLR